MTASRALETYRQLLAKVDTKFHQVQQRHPTQFRCGRGCYGCCQPGLTVSPVEKESIRAYLLEDPARLEAVEALGRANPHQGSHCPFLTAGGACAIYPVRPIVCRSHGAPLKVKPTPDSPRLQRDVCPLNFEGTPLEQLEEGDFIQLETLNTLLALINEQLRPGEAPTRTSLAPGAILA
jgi:Fe-S-cluster containining protein